MGNEIIKNDDISFKNEIVEKKNRIIEVLKKGKDFTPELLAILNDAKQITIEFSKEVMDRYKKGEYQLMEQASGNLKAIMVDKNNHKHVVEIGNVKAKDIFNVSPQEIVMHTMLFEIKQKLQIVIDDLNVIKNGIGDIHAEILRNRDAKCNAAIEAFNRYNLCIDKNLKASFLNTAIHNSINAYEELKNEIVDDDGLLKKIKAKYNEEYGYWKVKNIEEFVELRHLLRRLKYVLVEMNKLVLMNAFLYYNKNESLLLNRLLNSHSDLLHEYFYSEIIKMLYNCDEESYSISDNDWINMVNATPSNIGKVFEISLMEV